MASFFPRKKRRRKGGEVGMGNREKIHFTVRLDPRSTSIVFRAKPLLMETVFSLLKLFMKMCFFLTFSF